MRNPLPILALLLLASATYATETSLGSEDLDHDGVPEIVLANQFLRVELMTGEPPAPVEPSWREKWHLGGKQPELPPKYDKRFVWGGWIYNIQSVPTGRRWFTNKLFGKEYWHGIPEEFGQTVKMAELPDGTFACLKMGIGETIGRGLCLRGDLTLTKPAPWKVEATVVDGTGVVIFTQTVTTEYGYAYEYRKEFRLPPDSAVLTVKRTLTNTGQQPIHTTWYSHGFWGQANNGHDSGCWSTVPIQDLAGDAAAVDTTLCRVTDLTPICYWGPISTDEIAEPWYASGHSPTQEVFLSTFSERLAWMRVWTHAETYSCEPFVLIDLEPGQAKTWTVTRAAMQGLDAATAGSPQALLELGGTDEGQLQASLATVQPLTDVQVHLRVRPSGSDKDLIDQTVTLAQCGPDWPGRIRLEREQLPDGLCDVHLIVTHAGETLLDTTRRIQPRTAGLPPAWLGAATGQRAVILADVRRENGAIKPASASSYWSFALARAGFETVVLPVGEGANEGVLDDAQVVILAGPVRLNGKLIGCLTSFVDQGGGLVVTGPTDFRAFEQSDLLPVADAQGEINVQVCVPRDGTREFLDAPELRYQLQPKGDHPILRGLPFYPSALQAIARLQVVQPRPGAQVLVSYTGPSALSPHVDSPALVVGTHGQGRVAVFASPINWGNPPQWSIWSRLGEYHQQFFGQMAQWAAGQPSGGKQ